MIGPTKKMRTIPVRMLLGLSVAFLCGCRSATLQPPSHRVLGDLRFSELSLYQNGEKIGMTMAPTFPTNANMRAKWCVSVESGGRRFVLKAGESPPCSDEIDYRLDDISGAPFVTELAGRPFRLYFDYEIWSDWPRKGELLFKNYCYEQSFFRIVNGKLRKIDEKDVDSLPAGGKASETPRYPLLGGEPAGQIKTAHSIYGYSWSNVKPELDNVVPFRWLTMDNIKDPAGMKTATDKMPSGHRVVFLWDVHRDIMGHPQDRCRDAQGNVAAFASVWLDHGVDRVCQRLDDFFRRYKELGGQLDIVVLDWEEGLSNWHFDKGVERWKAIEADPRFPEISRRLGFSDLTTVAEWWKQKDDLRLNYLRWNAVMYERTASYLSQAVYEPIKKHYPQVKLSNYGHYHYCKALGVPDINGHRYYLFGSGAHVGTHQSSDLYTWLGQIDRNPPEGLKEYPHTPFNGFRHALNVMRCMAGSSDVPIYPWIAYRGFSEGYTGVTNHDLYQELIFHAGLIGADAFLFWNPRPWAKDQGASKFASSGVPGSGVSAGAVATSDEQNRIFSDCLRQLDALAGRVDRRPLARKLVPWTEDYALSGMQVGDRTVWRFTPNLDGGAKRESTLVSPPAAIFKVGSRRITIPGGKLFVPETELSGQGYWVVAPGNVEEPHIE